MSETSKININGRIRNYTKTTMFEKLQEENIELHQQLKVNLAKWAKMIYSNENIYCDDVLSEVKLFINELSHIFNFSITGMIKTFIDNTIEDITEEELITNNIYTDNEIEIEVNNIHSVKGETHIATLYFETSYYLKCESEMISDQLKGVAYTGNKTRHLETLKMAYVAMSRPRYLLCMAIHNDHFNFRCSELNALWDIDEI